MATDKARLLELAGTLAEQIDDAVRDYWWLDDRDRTPTGDLVSAIANALAASLRAIAAKGTDDE